MAILGCHELAYSTESSEGHCSSFPSMPRKMWYPKDSKVRPPILLVWVACAFHPLSGGINFLPHLANYSFTQKRFKRSMRI